MAGIDSYKRDQNEFFRKLEQMEVEAKHAEEAQVFGELIKPS